MLYESKTCERLGRRSAIRVAIEKMKGLEEEEAGSIVQKLWCFWGVSAAHSDCAALNA